MLAGLQEAIRSSSPGGPLLLDFDETLWLRNSTEAYLASARPRFVAVLLLKLMDFLEPWRWLPEGNRDHLYRDWLRVLLTSLVLPWSLPWWRLQARKLGPRHMNPELVRLLQGCPPRKAWVVTNGFRPIVAPLLATLGAPRPALLASPLLNGFAWRRRGKRAIVQGALGQEALAQAVLVTDNDEDAPLAQACARSFHHKWPGAAYIPATADAYVPFDYMENVKRPGQRHFARVVMGEDLIIVWLAYLWMAPFWWWALPALLLLHLSFWAIYEIGYVENDLVAARLEEDPVLSTVFFEKHHRFSRKSAWLAGLALGAAGVVLATWAHGLALGWWPTFLTRWALYLIGVRTLSYAYNHLDKTSRVLPYFALQASKFVGIALIFDLPQEGAILLSAHLVGNWIPYVVYRYARNGTAWRAPLALFRLVIFLMIGLLVIIANPHPTSDVPALTVMGLWLAWKARRDVTAYVAGIRWLPAEARARQQEPSPRPAAHAPDVEPEPAPLGRATAS